MGEREVNMVNTVSKIGWEGGGSTSIWIMSGNILGFFWAAPLKYLNPKVLANHLKK